MTSLQLLANELVVDIAPPIQTHGFNAEIRKRSFVRRTNDVSQGFGLAFVFHKPTDFDVTMHVGIRFEAFHKLDDDAQNVVDPKERATGYTIGGELGNVSVGHPLRLGPVTGSQDLSNVRDRILSLFEQTALPYLERFSDMSRALELVSSDESESWFHSPVHDWRARAALGLAFLLRDKPRFRELAVAKEAYLRGRNDFCLPRFLRLKKFLETRL